jgi:glycosyltransferase involved in cell wall biosynthesis
LHRTNQPILSVIIPVYNGASTLGACLESVFASKFLDFEVIVIDDRSTDASARIASTFPCSVITLDENAGPGVARNIGVSRSAGQILYFLDADIVVNDDTFHRLVQDFSEHPEYDAIFGCFEKETGEKEGRPGNFVSAYKNLLHHYTHQTSHAEACTFCSGLGAVRRGAFLKIDGFDPQWRFMEDVDLGYRLHLAGYRIWLDKDLRSTHLKHYTLASLVRSDVLGRAIPWTRIMLESRQFRNDLNTRFHHVASVPISILLLVSLMRWELWLPVTLPLAVIFLALNRQFLGFLLRERGIWFAMRSAGMCWLGYLYSGVGAAAGLLAHAWDRIRGVTSKARDASRSSDALQHGDDRLAKTAQAGHAPND